MVTNIIGDFAALHPRIFCVSQGEVATAISGVNGTLRESLKQAKTREAIIALLEEADSKERR